MKFLFVSNPLFCLLFVIIEDILSGKTLEKVYMTKTHRLDLMEPCSTQTVRFLTLPKKRHRVAERPSSYYYDRAPLPACQKIFTVN